MFKNYWDLLCGRNYSKHFINISSFISYNPMWYNYHTLLNTVFIITRIVQVRKLRHSDLQQMT